MAKTSPELLEMILRECAGAGAQPWYPSVYAQATGVPREALDASLDELRLGGLIGLTEWVQGRGQGYVLTPEGQEIVNSPRQLSRLRSNGVVPQDASVSTLARPPAERPTAYDRGEEVRSAVFTPILPRVTIFLLLANLLVFAGQYALAARNQIAPREFFDGKSRRMLVLLRDTGALDLQDIVVNRQWWRLLTCCFVHIGLGHLAINMVSLFLVGPLIERMWGSFRFLLLYLITGLVGSCTVVLFSEPSALTAGASGALLGIVASIATWLLLNHRHLPREIVSGWISQLLLVLVLSVCISLWSREVSTAGHVGGAVAGLIVALPLNYLRFGRGWQRWLAALGVAAVPLGSLAAVEYGIAPIQSRSEFEAIWPEVRRFQFVEPKLFHDYAQRLVPQKPAARRRDPDAPEARRDTEALLRRTQGIADRLNAVAGGLRDPADVERAQATQQYLAAALAFYKQFERSLDPQVRWTEQDEQLLRQLLPDLTVKRADLARAVDG